MVPFLFVIIFILVIAVVVLLRRSVIEDRFHVLHAMFLAEKLSLSLLIARLENLVIAKESLIVGDLTLKSVAIPDTK